MQRLSIVTAVFFLGSTLLLAGCDSEKEKFKPVDKTGKKVEDEHDDHHHHDAPHGGHIIELGGGHEIHAEIVFDEKEKKVTLYILDGEMKNLPVDPAGVKLNLIIDGKGVLYKPAATPQKGDPPGKSSRLVVEGNKQIAEHVHDEEELEGKVTITIDGTLHSGKIEHHHHDGEEPHKH